MLRSPALVPGVALAAGCPPEQDLLAWHQHCPAPTGQIPFIARAQCPPIGTIGTEQNGVRDWHVDGLRAELDLAKWEPVAVIVQRRTRPVGVFFVSMPGCDSVR